MGRFTHIEAPNGDLYPIPAPNLPPCVDAHLWCRTGKPYRFGAQPWPVGLQCAKCGQHGFKRYRSKVVYTWRVD